MGAILGGASEAQIQALRAFGSDLGMTFQIVDDLLDITGSRDDLGKPTGNDLKQGTVTLPVMLYADRLNRGGPEWRELEAVVRGDQDEPGAIERVLERIRGSGAVEETLAAAESFVEGAKNRVAGLPDANTRDLLGELADFSLSRLN